MNSVIQHRIDVVPHSRSEQMLAGVKQPETDRAEKEDIRLEENKSTVSGISLLAA